MCPFLTSHFGSTSISLILNYYNYFTEIEDTFIRRRGKNLFLSPLDWALMEAWQDRGIPLHIVIRSIESVFDVFDKQPPGTRTIKSLFYCREEIEVQYSEWAKSQAGKSRESGVGSPESEFSADAITAHIGAAIEALNANPSVELREELGRAVLRLEELRANMGDDFETIDATLSDIEKVIDRAMLTNWEPVHLKALEKEVAGQLRGYKADMDAAAYKNTFDLMMLKRLREEAGVPRLGLFYL
ncbi:hypothetical protein BH10ACI3_BH10ACI3_12260 [soil metagenome]